MSAFKRELVITGLCDELPQVIDFIGNACEQARVDPSARFDLQLSVEEACCNVIEHAYCGKGGECTVRFETSGRDVMITVHDYGRTFDPANVVNPDVTLPLEDRPIGGLGLYLMRQLMDEVRFSFSEQDGNTLVMVKRGAVTTETDHA